MVTISDLLQGCHRRPNVATSRAARREVRTERVARERDRSGASFGAIVTRFVEFVGVLGIAGEWLDRWGVTFTPPFDFTLAS